VRGKIRKRLARLSKDGRLARHGLIEVADHYEVRVHTKIKICDSPAVAILEEADGASDTLIVIGVATRPSEALLFGNTADQSLENGRHSLLIVNS
jgi:nucleotide-binding universal stress UspA family protein